MFYGYNNREEAEKDWGNLVNPYKTKKIDNKELFYFKIGNNIIAF